MDSTKPYRMDCIFIPSHNHLREIAGAFGLVEKVYVCVDSCRVPGHGYAFIKFAHSADARDFLQRFFRRGCEIHRQHLRFFWARGSQQTPAQMHFRSRYRRSRVWR